MDHLLYWLSARTRGSWRQFRAAVEELHVPEVAGDDSGADDNPAGLPLYQELRLNMQRLAHVEFFTVGDALQWQIAPPVISTIDQDEGCFGALTGARSLRLLDRLTCAARNRIDITPYQGCPALVSFRLDHAEQAAEIAKTAGILIQKDAPRALLACLPPIDDRSLRRATPLPFGADWQVERFDPARLRWTESTREDAVRARRGLFRFALEFRRHILLCTRGMTFEIPAAAGKYFVLRRKRGLLEYDTATRRLSIPAVCRPPYLIERALTLCSGRLARYEAQHRARGFLRYERIPPDVASLAASLLRQELR